MAARYKRAVSNLLIGNDDFPAAAEKMLMDAGVLHANRRYDGAAYLAGYAVECSLKTILLMKALARATGATTAPSLALALATALPTIPAGVTNELKFKVKHQLALALNISLVHLHACGAVTRRYRRGVWPKLAVLRWTETSRYAAPGAVSAGKSRRWLGGAASVVATSVRAMRRDGVVTG